MNRRAASNAITPEVGTRWIYKGSEYEVVPPTGSLQIKDVGDSNWYPGVAYRPPATGDQLAHGDVPTYARRKDDFLEKFKAVTHGDEVGLQELARAVSRPATRGGEENAPEEGEES